MKIQVIGVGTVGSAFGEAMERLGHSVYYKNREWEMICSNPNLIFICTPETAIMEVLNKINYHRNLDVPVVIKSTITPTLYDEIKKEHSNLFLNINPEFIREKEALWMMLNPHYIVIGEHCKECGDMLEQLFKPFHCPIARMTPKTAILTKLFSNAYLSTAISFWNEAKMIADKEEGVNTYEIGRTVSLEPRIPRHGATLHGIAYSGKCLPKDMTQLIKYAESKGVDPVLLKAVELVNRKIKTY